jgi:hypothetical protein
MSVDTVEELELLLLNHEIDTSLYGKKGSKSLLQLFKEVQEGETVFTEENGNLIRNVAVANVCLIKNNKVLIEAKQLIHALNTERKRYMLLAEKCYPEELTDTSYGVVKRALYEELGIKNFDAQDIRKVVSEINVTISMSYPGLETKYSSTTYFINNDYGIPDNRVFTEYNPNGTARITAWWSWMTLDELSLYNNKLATKLSSAFEN